VNEAYERLPIVVQNLACTFAGWQRERARFTPYFHRILGEWERNLDAPVSTLHAIQRQRLDQLVRRAREHTRFWRFLPPPSEARDPEEAIAGTLANIPPLEKNTYRDRAEEFIADDIPRERLRKGKTSGTTGTALPLWYTPNTLAEEYATVWRLRRACGVRLGEPHLTFGGQLVVPLRQEAPPYWRSNWWGRQTLFSLYHMKPENLPAYVDAIHAAPATFVQGYPSSIHLIARAMLDAGRPLPKGRLAAVFTSSESLLAFQRDAIESAFGAPVRDRYGTSEFAVSMTGCAERRLHVDMEFGIVEVEVEEETDDFVRGPLLVTGFANDATPFLRYRIGDLGTRAKQPCPCGRSGDVFLDVDGRLEDYVVTPDGRWIGRLDHIFKDQLDVAEAQILQQRSEAIEVRIVPRGVWNDASDRSLRKEIRARLGDAIEIEMRIVETIPREPNGKFRAVKSALSRAAIDGAQPGESR
jgi:phenylacetate-CoA ligase